MKHIDAGLKKIVERLQEKIDKRDNKYFMADGNHESAKEALIFYNETERLEVILKHLTTDSKQITRWIKECKTR